MVLTVSPTYFSELSSDNCLDISNRLLTSIQRIHPLATDYNFQVCQLLRLGEPFSKSIVEKVSIMDHLQAHCTNSIVLMKDNSPIEYQAAVLSLCLPHATSLSISAKARVASPKFLSILDTATSHCRNVTKLDISWSTRGLSNMQEVMCRLIKKVGPTVNQLAFRIGPNPQVSVAFMKSVTNVIASSCTRLEKFSYSGHCLRILTPLWRAVGPTIKSLEITCSPRQLWNETLEAISQSCTNLTNVVINGAPTEQYERLLCRIGERLELSKVSDEVNPMPNCLKLRRHCPNALFQFHSNYDVEQVIHLISSLNSLVVNIRGEEHFATLEQALQAGADSLEIAQFNVPHPTTDTITRLFAHPLPQLRSLTIPLLPTLRKDTLDLLTKATSSLETLKIGVVNFENFAALDALCNSNMKLKDVVVRVCSLICAGQQKRIALGVVKSMRCCKKLNSLVVSGVSESRNAMSPVWESAMTEITDACLPLRRNTCIRVFGAVLDYWK